jgi:hypothetical protein
VGNGEQEITALVPTSEVLDQMARRARS